MFSQIRKIVAGPKKRTITQNFDLDFTYITDTVVAMAFPASGLQKTYRNSIDDVAKFLEMKHLSNYLIINVSNRKYDYKVFKDQVKDYLWEDHQAPTLDVIFQICSDSFQFLKENLNNYGVVCFHCNHGKGRTGTAIISLLIYTGFFTDVDEALKYYNKKRFQADDYGVSQPCQIRYMEYFLAAVQEFKSQNHRKTIKAYKLKKIEYEGLTDNYEISILKTRNQGEIFKKIEKKGNETIIQKSPPLMSDIYIEIIQKGWVSNKIAARANINLNFLTDQISQTEVMWEMVGSKVRINKSHHDNFSIKFYFEEFCKCHEQIHEECQCCFELRKVEQQYWEKMISLASKPSQFSSRDICKLLYPSQVIQVEEQQQQQQQQACKGNTNEPQNQA